MKRRIFLLFLLSTGLLVSCEGSEAPSDVVVDTGVDLIADDVAEDSASDVPTEPECSVEQCDDQNLCTVDRCDEEGGACVYTPVNCSDGDACNGREDCDPSTGECLAAPALWCPAAPDFCDPGDGESPAADRLTPVAPGGFRLYDEARWDEVSTLLDTITAPEDVSLVGIDDVLDDLDRSGQTFGAVPDVDCVAESFRWNAEDGSVQFWYPQGVTGAMRNADSPDGLRRLVLVSWYHKPGDDPRDDQNRGARVSLVDLTESTTIRYRHLLLVHPVAGEDGSPNFEAVTIHAGGIAWVDDWLYVADTTKGLRVFDLSRVLRLPEGPVDVLGPTENSYAAYGYRYAVPEVTRYRLCEESCCARFSFVAADRSSDPPTLLGGEYHVSSTDGRLHRWPLDPSTGRLVESSAIAAFHPGVQQMQGAVSVGDDIFITSSRAKSSLPQSPSTLFIARPDQQVEERTWPWGPEDLYYAEADDSLWSLSEHPGFRYVFRVPRTALLEGCE